MGLSVTATYGIIFTASLLMMGAMLNSILYAYNQFQNGLNNKIDLINYAANRIKIERVVYNKSAIEIIATNEGPKSLDMSKLSVIVNGHIFNVTSDKIWYPGDEERIFINTTYSMGKYHNAEFTMDCTNLIATTEYDKIYLLNSTELFAYNYDGTLAWKRHVIGPRDVSASSAGVFVLNATGIAVYDFGGQQQNFYSVTNLTSIDSRGPHIYALNSTEFLIINNTEGVIEKRVLISGGKDIAIGRDLYVLTSEEVKVYSPEGDYLFSVQDSKIANAQRISADWHDADGDFVVLTSYGNLRVYSNDTFLEEITLGSYANNVDMYGKIYISGSGLTAIDCGYRLKIVDEYGNEIYAYL